MSPSVAPGPAPAQIEVQLFDVADVEQAKRVLLSRGRLTLQLVEAQAATREALLAGHGGQVPEGLLVLTGRGDEPGESSHYLLAAQPVVSGRDLKRARASVDQYNQPSVTFTLSAPGAARFGEFTARHIGRQIAIVLDDRVESAPTIQSRIGADGQITGRFTVQESDELARILRAGALPAGVRVQSEVALPPASMARGILRAVAVAAVAFVVAVLVLLFYDRRTQSRQGER